MIRYDHEPPPGKNIAITLVSEVTTVFNQVLKMFHVVLECPNSFNSSVFRFALLKGPGEGIIHQPRLGTVRIAPHILTSYLVPT